MAAIYDPNREVDIGKLGNAIKDRLPSYARPIFIRLVKKLDITGSFSRNVFLQFIPYCGGFYSLPFSIGCSGSV